MLKLAQDLQRRPIRAKKAVPATLSLARQPAQQHSIASLPEYPTGCDQLTWLDTLFSPDPASPTVDRPLLLRLAIAEQPCLPRAVPLKSAVAKLYPTRDEQRRFRRIKKAEAARRTNQRVKLGLAPLPPPALRLSALPRILANNPQLNPTAVELAARQAQEERRQRHEAHNNARKLTRTGKKARLLRRLRRDSARGVLLSLFVVGRRGRSENLHALMRFLRRHYFNGRVVVPRGQARGCLPLVVAVEGGRRFSRLLQRLVERRVRWSRRVANARNARLAWRSERAKRHFADLRAVRAETLDAFAAPFHRHGLGSLLKLALNNA